MTNLSDKQFEQYYCLKNMMECIEKTNKCIDDFNNLFNKNIKKIKYPLVKASECIHNESKKQISNL